MRHDFSGLTHRAKKYFRFCPARFRPSWKGFHTLNWLRPRAFYANFTTPAPTVNGQMDDRLFVVVTRVGVKAATADPKMFFDNRFLQELESSGFVKELYGNK